MLLLSFKCKRGSVEFMAHTQADRLETGTTSKIMRHLTSPVSRKTALKAQENGSDITVSKATKKINK